MLEWVLARQGLTLLVAVGTLVLTVLLYVLVPKGFFPVQDTGAIQAITEAAQSISLRPCPGASRPWPRWCSRPGGGKPVVLHRRGWHQRHPQQRAHAHQPEAPRRARRQRQRGDPPPAGPELQNVAGIRLYMQPVQDLSIEDRASRTQYQFSRSPRRTRASSPNGCRAWSNACAPRPELADVASDLQDRGLQAWVDIDRDSASRLGVSPAAIDNALYNAFGQRLMSTIFTQATQYRVVLEVQPEFRSGPAAMEPICTSPAPAGAGAPVGGGAHQRAAGSTLAVKHIGQFPAVTLSFNLAPGVALGDAVEAIRAAEAELGLPAQHRDAASRARPWPSRPPWTNTLLLILAAVVTMYIVLGVLYESYHPPGDHPVHPALSRRRRPAGPAGVRP
jgi:multidrug efflux pump